ncbi:MAG: S8 family serine peptidase [Proteobacteria bacterium]|nr:S8 family serine peptidase [Pseudomonadota bacterium]
MKFLLALALALVLLAGCATPRDRIAPITLDDLRHFREARLAERLQARLVVSVKDERVDRYDAGSRVARELQAAGVRLADKVDMRLVEHYPIDALHLYVYVLEGDSVETVDRAERILEDAPDVKTVQRVNLFRTETAQPDPSDDITSNFRDDPLGPLQALPASELARLHEFATGEGVSIAIVDTGIDRNHEDLRGAQLDVRNLVDENRDMPVENHATAIAGIILAQPGNGIGISGIAPASRVIVLRACWQESREDSAYCNTFTLAKALAAALEADVDIVNLSLTGPMDPLLVQLVEALQARNVIVVAANADEPDQGPFPSALPGVISATSRPIFAQDPGPVYAPGSDVITLLPENRYGLRDGSSISAAQVSGVAGLFRERDPVMTAAALEGLLHGRGVEEEGLAGLLEALQKTEPQQ